METFSHTTVLLHETIDLVTERFQTEVSSPTARQLWADCTLGGAGHTLHLLEVLTRQQKSNETATPNIELICCDQDPQALAVAQERLNAWQAARPFLKNRLSIHFLARNFRLLPDWMKSHRPGEKICGLIADLGVSSPQIDSAERGFSFLREGPLDMRMNTQSTRTARDLLLTLESSELSNIFSDYGEEPRANALARAIVKDRTKGILPVSNTVEFANYVSRVLGYHQSRVHPATRIFQALRIAVNDELSAVEDLLRQLPELMAEGGIAGVISFHSLEDRLVKRYFRAWEQGERSPEEKRSSDKKRWTEAHMGLLSLTEEQRSILGYENPRGGIVASNEEIKNNPRARSARLRGFRFFESKKSKS